LKKNKAEIGIDHVGNKCYVYVLDEHGKQCFYREKSPNIISIAHTLYMYERYYRDYEARQKIKTDD